MDFARLGAGGCFGKAPPVAGGIGDVGGGALADRLMERGGYLALLAMMFSGHLMPNRAHPTD